jgi:predicted Fe-Mo cluster-binding NifX family protein
MKIAAVSEDGATISQHFGRAPLYVVVTVEDGKIIARETRPKLGHGHALAGSHAQEAHGADPRGHGFDAAAQDLHSRMAGGIADCEALLARGMGSGAYHSLEQAGIRPVVTDIAGIDEAALAYAAGQITNHIERLH